jgi:hypothetical protein
MMRAAMLTLPALLGSCAMTQAEEPATAPTAPAGECRNDALASFVGQTADADLGTRMLAASGARTLRWVAPGMAVTMDFRADRLTVHYDAAMKVTSASCG